MSKAIFVIIFGLAIQLFSQTAIAPSAGDGSESNPYQIEMWQNLYWLSQNPSKWDKYYIQTIDINFGEAEPEIQKWDSLRGFTPIGNSNMNFTGKYNGKGFSLDSLYISRETESFIGLFGEINYADLDSIRLENISIKGYNSVGGLCGSNKGRSDIDECHTSGNIEGNGGIGGIIGVNSYDYDGRIRSSSSSCNVNGLKNVGGFVGSNFGYIYYSSSLNSEIRGNESVGGFAGLNWIDYKIGNCFSENEVIGNLDVGGLIGKNHGKVTDSYSTGNVIGEMKVGGLIGFDYMTSLSNCYSTGNVTGSVETGGLVGRKWDGSLYNSHYNIDQVLINGGAKISTGGIYNDQFNDWIKNGLVLNIEDYYHTLPLSGDYHLIKNIESMKDMLGFSDVDSLKFLLENDIDLSLFQGFYIPRFTGTFNGNGHSISNLNIIRSDEWYIGLFGFVSGYVSKGIISNLAVVNSNVVGNSYTGGLIGRSSYNKILNCSQTGFVGGNNYYVGGLVGYADGVDLDSCFSISNTSGGSGVGGLTGVGGYIKNSFSEGKVTGENLVGGLTGSSRSITNCYSVCEVIGDSSYIGGLAGANTGGYTEIDYGIIKNSYSRGNVTVRKETSNSSGGFCGQDSDGIIENCYSTGNVYYNGSNPTNKGFLGLESGDNFVFNSNFFDNEASNQLTDLRNAASGTSTSMMKTLSTFTDAGWDFVGEAANGTEDIWDIDPMINDGYPYLYWITTGIEDDNETLPQEIQLSQNYPNPFNPETKITFSIPSAQDVKLTVYNSNGQLVRKLINEKLSAGKHSKQFNGESLNSGIYFYTLQTGDKKLTRKMLLIK
jgi:hypothetical protein